MTIEFQFINVLSCKKKFPTDTKAHNTNYIDENLQSVTFAIHWLMLSK